MSSEDTLVNTNVIIDAVNNAVNGLRQEINQSINGLRQEINESINGLRQEMNERLDKVEQRLTNVEARLRFVEDKVMVIETDAAQIKQLQFVFENEIDRLQAMIHQSLNLAHENRADVRIMRKEISA